MSFGVAATHGTCYMYIICSNMYQLINVFKYNQF